MRVVCGPERSEARGRGASRAVCRGSRGRRARAQTSCPAAGLVSARAGVGYDLCDESLSLLSDPISAVYRYPLIF